MRGAIKVMLIICFMILWHSVYAESIIPDLWNPLGLLKEKWVRVSIHPLVQAAPHTWVTMSITWINKMPTSLEYWLKRLPYDQDKTGYAYIVIPRLWVVSPIVDIPNTSKDYTKVIDWLSINYNNYLRNGVVRYPWASVWQPGNTILAWHSAYWKSDIWRYKNIFFTLPLLQFGDQIWVYVKNQKWIYDRYKYMVWESYETDPKNVSVLEQNTNSTLLTLFTCVPIGTVKNRWVVQARYIATPKKTFIINPTN